MKTRLIKTLQLLGSIGVVVLLTGANDNGCSPEGGGVDPGQTTSVSSGGALQCGPGTHEEKNCVVDDQMNETCDPICVPDQQCPPGTVGNEVCPPPDPKMGPGCAPPPCFIECVPVDPCGPGFHVETVCGDPPPPPNMTSGVGGADPGMTTSTGVGGAGGGMGGGCWDECVPDDPSCPPGQHIEKVCDPDFGDCWPECVDDGDLCGPDFYTDWVCKDPNDPMTCEPECVPIEVVAKQH